MVKNWPLAGEMASRITFLENTTPVSASGVVKKDELAEVATVSAKRIDGTGNADDEGRLLDVAMVTYQVRFNSTLFAKGGSLVVRDFDGEYDVKGPFQIVGGRNRYMQCQAVKRG